MSVVSSVCVCVCVFVFRGDGYTLKSSLILSSALYYIYIGHYIHIEEKVFPNNNGKMKIIFFNTGMHI